MNALGFFSGALGLDLGLERAGFGIRLACESDRHAAATIRENRPHLPLLADFRAITSPQEVREAAGLSEDEEVALVFGGPPCQSFSTAGGGKGAEDERGSLLQSFVDLAVSLNPRVVMLENVRGLLAHRDVLSGAMAALEAAGYEVAFNLYNSANFGTPQRRERLILTASRGSAVPYLRPTHNAQFGLPHWRTFREAVEGLTVCEHIPLAHDRIQLYRQIGPGENWRALPVDQQKLALGGAFGSSGGKTSFLRRVAWDEPTPTLVTNPAQRMTSLAHPTFDRVLSVQEYARLQQFPDDFVFMGPLRARYKQIGNAVPVGLAEAAGRAIAAHLQGQTPPQLPEGWRHSRYLHTDDAAFRNTIGKKTGERTGKCARERT